MKRVSRPPAKRAPDVPRSTLTLSHSSAGTFGLCPELYRLKYVEGLTNASEAGGCDREFGRAMHVGLAAWELTRALERAQMALAASWTHDESDTDHKSLSFAQGLLEAYSAEWEEPLGKQLLAETTLVARLGQIDGTEVRFGGTLDLIALTGTAVTVVDFKTTGLGWSRWWATQRSSNQWPGYAWLVSTSTLCGKRTPGVLVRYLNTRETLTPHDERFRETLILPKEEEIAEWRSDMLALAGEILRCHATGVWRHTRSACGWQYGRPCEFYDHCILPPDSRARHLALNGNFVPRTASPTEANVRLGLV